MSDSYYRYMYGPSYRYGYTPSTYNRYSHAYSSYPARSRASYGYGGSRGYESLRNYSARGIESYGVDYYDYLRYNRASSTPRYYYPSYRSSYFY